MTHGHGTHGTTHQEMAAMRIGSMSRIVTEVNNGKMMLGTGGIVVAMSSGVVQEGIVGEIVTKSTMDFQAVKVLQMVMSCHGVSCPLAKQCRSMKRPTRMRKGGALARSPAHIHQSSKQSKARITETGNVL